MIVIATGFIPFSPLSIVLDYDFVGKQPLAWKEYYVHNWFKEIQ